MTTIFEHAVMNGIHAEPISRYCDEGLADLFPRSACAASPYYPRPIYHRERGVISSPQSG